jgi:hypothetical protein
VNLIRRTRSGLLVGAAIVALFLAGRRKVVKGELQLASTTDGDAMAVDE